MPDTCLRCTLNRLIPCLILALASSVASSVAASDFVSPSHFFPVVSRTDGLAGTTWLTSVQIVNPQAESLTITAHLSAGGFYRYEIIVVPAGETHNWPDFLGDVFGFVGNSALYLEAEAYLNQDRSPECRGFAASMRISTTDNSGGSFGQGVPTVDPVTGFLGDWIAYFPAVALWGQPGTEGFRTNVGFWNIGANDARLRLKILDASGQQVWQQLFTARRHHPFVMSLPRDLQLETATLVVDPLGEWVDCAVYISVVDNITGDAGFQTSQLMDPDASTACGGGGSATGKGTPERGSDRLRALFLGGPR